MTAIIFRDFVMVSINIEMLERITSEILGFKLITV